MITSKFEPLLPTDKNGILDDLAPELLIKSSLLTGSIRPEILLSVSELVRSMNCYYSNLIEGHHKTPRQIDQALDEDYSDDPEINGLQHEVSAHINVQKSIDEGSDITDGVAYTAYTQWLHKEFCSNLLESMLTVERSGTTEKLHITPGKFRVNVATVTSG